MHVIGWRRLLSALLGLWFTAYAAEPAALVACPMHGGSSVRAEASGEHGGAAAPGQSSHHAGARPASAADDAPQHSHAPGPHTCTCLGHCCASSVAVIRGGDSPCPVAAVVSAVRIDVPRVGRRVPALVDHRLPFATAPPLA
jgi:hypothetical protein